ncbi:MULTISPECIES: sensor histidine kinase [unclassified Burkholderia]|uniref:sensor histidine kinase n=1 Tax=unclassified Burkholderia TaxID=2613784 RepID=UPI000755ACC5|nr:MULTISPECIES: ATP-binding protein [unclassified Burkholderia]KUY48841.1 histidine kinase [Burkholderia sp. RF2-non_BP3]KVE35866.1 histidine kinase [Burkholderia sp. BDU5]
MSQNNKAGAQPFRIAARAMRQLGAELITSDEMALYELIKNSFDAGSARATVSISAPADSGAVTLVREQLEQNGLSKKVALERLEKALSNELTLDQRADILAKFENASSSAKSLAARLATFVENDFWIEVRDTGIGMTEDELRERFMVVGTPYKMLEKRAHPTGSRTLLGEKGIGRLSMMKLGAVAEVRSKVEGESNWNSVTFDWTKFDDPEAFLGEITFEVLPDNVDKPEVRGTVITIRRLGAHWSTAKVRDFLNKYVRRLQNPFDKSRKTYPIDVLLNGHRLPIVPLPRWLSDASQFRAEIRYNPDGPVGAVALRRELTWKGTDTAESRTWTLEELARIVDLPVETCRSLGPFTASCLWFNRGLLSGTVDKTKKQLLEELNVWCGGFAVYRDGFRVGQTGGMDDDWLEWDSKALRTKGFTLNRYQTVGSIAISSQANPRLVDAANRERLVSCPEQNLLVAIFSGILVLDLRAHIDAIKQVEVKRAIEEESTEESLRRSEDSLVQTLKTVEDIGRALPSSVRPKIDEIRQVLRGQVEYVETIRNALKLSRETRVELLELANIGLVVEIVVHELTRLTQKTGDLLIDLKKSNSTDPRLVILVDNLQAQIKATNKRISTVDVMSPSGRNRREQYDVVAQVKTVVAGFEARFERHKIAWEILVDGVEARDQRLLVYLVRGLIAQVLENLLTNSVYWVQQSLKDDQDQRRIVIEIDTRANSVTVTDNGPGIDPASAEAVFKPYYTTRKRGKGLGLYIARELVEYHGGKLYLDASGERDGRLRTFVLELPMEGR